MELSWTQIIAASLAYILWQRAKYRQKHGPPPEKGSE